MAGVAEEPNGRSRRFKLPFNQRDEAQAIQQTAPLIACPPLELTENVFVTTLL
jgi:hypothetical protein